MSQPPHPESTTYIHRRDAESAFQAALEQPGPLLVADLSGLHWTGKTRVLQHLQGYLRDRYPGGASLASVDLARFRQPAPTGEQADAETLAAHQGLYHELLAGLAFELLGLSNQQFNRLIRPRFWQRQSINEFGISIPTPFGPLEPRIGSSERRDALADLNQQRANLTAVFASRVNRAIKDGRRIFIFLDNFCQIQNTVLEKWILQELAPALPQARLVLGRSNAGVGLPFAGKVTHVNIPVLPYTLAETTDFVRQTLDARAVELGWPKEILRHSRGNPMLTSWMVRAVQAHPEQIYHQPPETGFLPSILGLVDDNEQKLVKLVNQVFNPNPDMLVMLNTACVLRTFTFDGIAKALAGKVEERQLPAMWDTLLKLPGVDQEGSRITINDVLASSRENALRSQQPGEVNRIHQIAANHYRQRTLDFEDRSSAGIWDQMHLYEDPEFQFDNRRWLYHTAALDDPASFMFESATRYFDAFFWWGEFLPFPFCDQLIHDLNTLKLGQSRAHQVTREWIALLQDFHTTFRPRRLRAAAPDWVKPARGVIEDMLERTQPADPDQASAEQLHLKAILTCYLAETYRVECAGSQNQPAYRWAVGYFNESIQCLKSAEDLYKARALVLSNTESGARAALRNQAERETWFAAWLWVWLVNLQAEHGESQAALDNSLLAEQVVLAADSSDVEALARIHCARALAYESQKAWPGALAEFQEYAFHALAFLVKDYKTGGDLYTVEFFREMIEVTGLHLAQVQSAAPEVARQWWAAWLAFWTTGETSLLPDGVDPQPPEPLSSAWVLDPTGRMASHRLPLPRLPASVDPQSGDLHIPWQLPKEYRKVMQYLKGRRAEQPAPYRTN